jgi:YD repeat-containing protein
VRRVFELDNPNGTNVFREKTWTSASGHERITYSYDTSKRLHTVESSDDHSSARSLATFTYPLSYPGDVVIAAPGGRTTTLTQNSVKQLSKITDPGSAQEHFFTYTPDHRLTRRTWTGQATCSGSLPPRAARTTTRNGSSSRIRQPR